MADWEKLVDGIDFGEGPRWHDGRLWYSDFYQASIYAVSMDGTREAVHSDLPDQPSGLGWLPDGTLLVVFMLGRRLMREVDGELVEHADLSEIATGPCNDMVVDGRGNAYVGNFGFDMFTGEAPRSADLALVRPDGSIARAATDLRFPNGSVITPDGSTLIVGETMGDRYQAWTIGEDGTLSDQRVWSSAHGAAPDGCTLDAGGGIWLSDARASRVVRIEEGGGGFTHDIATPQPTFACMLGGDDGRTLFALCAPSAMPADVAGVAGGAIYTTQVDHPHAGHP